MEKELIINAADSKTEIALIENSKLVELHHEEESTQFSVGDVYLGRIKKLMPNLNAAFVDIGENKDAFLHYTDLGPKMSTSLKFVDFVSKKKWNTHLLDRFRFEPDIIKNDKIEKVLSRRQMVLVQILKEPISTKGPRLSCELTIPGRFLILTPFSNTVAISKKITQTEERNRLKTLIESIKPKNFGIIVRTAAEGKKVSDLHEELSFMINKWEQIFKKLYNNDKITKLLSEVDKTSGLIRDLLNDSFSKIVVNDQQIHDQISTYLHSIAPKSVNILGLHKKGKRIFDEYGVTKQIKTSFGKTATMTSGAYLVIEHTEAMHVIDVNSGHKVINGSQSSAILAVNIDAANEIARQLRLRDIGGLIIIDFIDMKSPDDRKNLLAVMRDAMSNDRAQHTILPLSKFGLMQITRQRVRPEVKINTDEKCPACQGTGKINASILVVDQIKRDLNTIIHSRPSSKFYVKTHEFVASHLKHGFPSIQMNWLKEYFKWVPVKADPELGILEYRFFDENNDEIRL